MDRPAPQHLVHGRNAADVKDVAKDKLGGYRHTLHAELKAVPDLLALGERILTMAVAASGWRGRMLVVTDRALVFIGKTPLRPVRCERYPYGEVASLQVFEKPIGTEIFRLEFTHGSEQMSWTVMPPGRGLEIAGIAGVAPDQGSLEP